MHQLKIPSLTGLSALSIGPVPLWGDDYTVSVAGIPMLLQVPEPYATVGSSLREVSSPGTNLFYGVFPGGPSEDVLSDYFSNQMAYWENHDYYDMNNQTTVVTIEYV